MARGFNYAPGASAELGEAARPGLHKTHIMALGSSRNPLVRAAIATRDDCPLGLMVTLAHDYSAEVRCAVARNPRAQRTVMAYLSADRSVDVLKALLENPSLPADVVEELAFHRKSDVRAAAAARLDAGELPSPAPEPEDLHTPEVAEHVAPFMAPIAADGTPAPANVVDIATGAPIAPQPPFGHLPQPGYAPPQPAYVAPVPSYAAPTQQPQPPQEPAIPQIFAPHSTPDAPAPTRTAPVRGFKPKS